MSYSVAILLHTFFICYTHLWFELESGYLTWCLFDSLACTDSQLSFKRQGKSQGLLDLEMAAGNGPTVREVTPVINKCRSFPMATNCSFWVFLSWELVVAIGFWQGLLLLTSPLTYLLMLHCSPSYTSSCPVPLGNGLPVVVSRGSGGLHRQAEEHSSRWEMWVGGRRSCG